MTDRPTAQPSAAALRMRRHRQLREAGAVLVQFVVAPDAVQRLVNSGWLTESEREDRDAVTTALVRTSAASLNL